MKDRFSARGYPDRVLQDTQDNQVRVEGEIRSDESKKDNNAKRIPFVRTFHQFTGKVDVIIKKPWPVLQKSFPGMDEFR